MFPENTSEGDGTMTVVLKELLGDSTKLSVLEELIGRWGEHLTVDEIASISEVPVDVAKLISMNSRQ